MANTTRFEQGLIDKLHPMQAAKTVAVAGSDLPVEGTMPELNGAIGWLNTPPLTRAALRGKVVMVDFWTYSCINCLRALPYIRAWAAKYKDHGLVVLGVHAPEFAFEKDPANVRKAVKDLGVTYPVALDSNLAIWQAFNNQYWPAHYFIDGQGRIRAHHFGEGEYDKSERVIQTLLKEAGYKDVPGGIVNPDKPGLLAAADENDMELPETYLGYGRGAEFCFRTADAGQVRHSTKRLIRWAPINGALPGAGPSARKNRCSDAAGGKITFYFHARDLHLVMGPANGNKPVRFKMTLDGQPPGAAHGVDSDDGRQRHGYRPAALSIDPATRSGRRPHLQH